MVQHWIEHREGESVTEAQARALLSSLEAWERTPEDHRAETPARFVKALKELTTREDFKFTTFPATSRDMVTLAPIPFYTLCAHHVVPFYGHAYISYVPNAKLAGLSKFARMVKWAAKGFWVQEELTAFIADELTAKLNTAPNTQSYAGPSYAGMPPSGVGVVLKAEHLCMAMRGVAQPGVITTTAAMRGVYADHTRTAKAEFLDIVKHG